MIAAVATTALLLAACGGDDPEVTGEADATEEPADDPADEPDDEMDEEPAEAAPFDETIDFVVPYEPGGGYDQYVRLLAPALAECLDTDVIPVNEPGAGSLLATNRTAIADTDGSRIQIYNTIGAIAAQVGGAEGVNFDLAEMTWLARIADEPSLLSVATDSEFQSFEDMLDADRTLRFGATGPGSNEYMFAASLARVFDMDVEIVTGFAGSGEVQASVIQGDLDAIVISIGSSLGPIEAGDMIPLLLVGQERHDAAPDTPTVYEFDQVEGEEPLLDGIVGLVETARSISGPPGMDEETTRALRDGLECAINNETFLSQAEDQGRDVSYLSGDETQDLVTSVLDPPPALVELLEDAF
jgi:tripartite-type tricarboxylate transporter receptor subunit TctC